MTTTTIATYVGNGSQTNFAFGFDYLRREFVNVKIDGVDTPFTFVTSNTIQITPAPAAGKVIVIRRLTDRDRLVEFVDGSILTAGNLNISALQAIHIAAEALDQASGGLLIDESGAYSAGFRRITQAGAPTQPSDLTTKQWVETGVTSSVVQAESARVAAPASQSAAAASQSAAATSATAAAGSATTANSQRVLAETARTGAETARTGAEAAQTAAQTARTGAEAARDTTLSYRNQTQVLRDEVQNATSPFFIPSGGIILWSGAANAIPSGWVLCDGNNGTPNLRDRFVVGAGGAYAVGATGGANTVALGTNEIPSHSHTFSGTTGGESNGHTHSGTTDTQGAHAHTAFGTMTAPYAQHGGGGAQNGDYTNSTTSTNGAHAHNFTTGDRSASHTHGFSGTTAAVGSGAAHENRPPYFALCYIMKT